MRGSKKHFWVKSESTQRKKPTLEEHALIRKNTKKNYWNSLKELEMVKHVLKRHEIETGNDFYKVVASNDATKSGFITKIAFVYTMSKVYQLSKEQIESLLSLLEE